MGALIFALIFLQPSHPLLLMHTTICAALLISAVAQRLKRMLRNL